MKVGERPLAMSAKTPAARRDLNALTVLYLALGAFLWNLEGPFMWLWWTPAVVAGILGARLLGFALIFGPFFLLVPSYKDTQSELFALGYVYRLFVAGAMEVIAGMIAAARARFLNHPPLLGSLSSRDRAVILLIAVALSVGAVLLGVPFGQGESGLCGAHPC